eukprot:scaffold48514_cov55-Attheya_sp.AAC.2
MVPFECDECHFFRKITGRNPMSWSLKDVKLLEFICQANLDAFWSRSSNTVKNNLSDANRLEKMGQHLGMGPMAPAIGPFPLKDEDGMQFAVALLEMSSLSPGKNEEFVQWATF